MSGFCSNKKVLKPMLALKMIKEIFPFLYYLNLDEIAGIVGKSGGNSNDMGVLQISRNNSSSEGQVKMGNYGSSGIVNWGIMDTRS